MLEATGQAPKTEPREEPAAVALGKLGGAKGDKAPAAPLSPAKKRVIAKKAAKARWAEEPRSDNLAEGSVAKSEAGCIFVGNF